MFTDRYPEQELQSQAHVFSKMLLQPHASRQWIRHNCSGAIQLKRTEGWTAWIHWNSSSTDPKWASILRARYWNAPTRASTSKGEQLSLQGLRIVLDPGHIGGRWAAVEERSVPAPDGRGIAEGDLTLALARWLLPQLQAKGAWVELTRNNTEPSVPPPQGSSAAKTRQHCRRLEIAARARRINRHLRPDCVICLHFDAAPYPTSNNHWHLLVNGAYTAAELSDPRQRLALAWRYLSGTALAEQQLASACVSAFQRSLHLPAYRYPPSAAAISGNAAGIWHRNLMANRLYRCPVLFTEAYLLNNPTIAQQARAELDVFEATQVLPTDGLLERYATAIVRGLSEWARTTIQH